MARLVVNPGSPEAWELNLKPGANTIGRAPANDFKLEDGSVSGSHCQIIAEQGRTSIKDLGSTNGTFVNRTPIREAVLQHGQTVQLGGVTLMFFDDSAPTGPSAPAPVAVRAMPPPVPVAASGDTVRLARPAGLKIGTPAAAPVAVVAAVPPPSAAISPIGLHAAQGALEAVPPAAPILTGGGPCKHHPRTPGRYFCPQCRLFFCELCVSSRAVGAGSLKTCRQCGSQCTPVHVEIQRPAGPKGFFARLPSAFIYPFRGSGLLVLIISALVFTGLSMMQGGMLGILGSIIVLGYLFSYMQNIIHATANEEEQMPELPGFDDVFGGAFRMAVVMVVCFGAPITFFALRFFDVWEDLPYSATLITLALGCFYFPMAFLAVAMKDTALACNPLVVMPAIFKVPAGYLVTVIVVLGVMGMRMVGDIVSAGASAVSLSTRDMSTLFITFGIRAFWQLMSMYLLTVSMRTLGLLYACNKQKFGWFDR
ncbi:MAG: hypothetical protein C5B50_13635 [Verrucomicrobia bacterium]|nr:MAG: hypothetical protein C5B50_13635 [Verrucomicrobiota bacterium]